MMTDMQRRGFNDRPRAATIPASSTTAISTTASMRAASMRAASTGAASTGATVTSSGPTVLRIALGAQLRQLREAAGLSREAAGQAVRGSAAKIGRLELGRVGFKERDVLDLLARYGITDPERRRQFVELARRANSPGWWHQYSDQVEPWFETYVGLEQAASVIRTYECQFVPGLLQTRDYARAVTRLAHDDEVDVERRVELRMRRQELITRDGVSQLWAVIDEAALRRPLVGRELARTQLRHLIELADLPQITIQIAPFAHGGHPAAGGPFTILRFAEPDLPDIVYLEQLTSALYLDKPADVERYAAVMSRLCAQMEPPGRTREILEGIRRRL